MAWQQEQIWSKKLDSILETISQLSQNLVETTPIFWDESKLPHGNNIMDASGVSAKDAFLRKGVFVKILTCLFEFAEKQGNYFLDGFTNGFTDQNNSGPPIKEESDDFPPDHVMSVTLDQISYDLAVIQRAISQRVLASPEEIKTIIVADWLANDALKPSFDIIHPGMTNITHAPPPTLMENKTLAITYFHKEASIRMIPYANVALIAVPFSAVKVPQDYLAIPHEVGHFVFWRNSYFNDSSQPLTKRFDPSGQKFEKYEELLFPLDNQRSLRKSVAYNWYEELFADVYGCLIAGPSIALSFQDLQLEKERDEFDHDDGIHPSPVIRPRVYTKTLRKPQDQLWTAWADELDVVWDQRKIKRNKIRDEFETATDQRKFVLKAFSVNKGAFGKNINRRIIQQNVAQLALSPQNIDLIEFQELDDAIEEIYELISSIKGKSNDWLNLSSSPPNHQELYAAFIEKINQLKLELNRLQNELDERDSKVDSICIPGNLQENWHEHGRVKESNPTWRHVFKAEGWATKGPDGRFDPE